MNSAETAWVERVAAILAYEPQWCPIREHYCRCNPRCVDAYAAEALICECCGSTSNVKVRRKLHTTCSDCQARIDSGSADAEDGRDIGRMWADRTRGER